MLRIGLVEPKYLLPYFRPECYPRLVAIIYWLIDEVYAELGDYLADVDLSVIRIGRGRWGPGTYPVIWVDAREHEMPDMTIFDIESAIEDACDSILRRTSNADLYKAITEHEIDWVIVTEEELFRFYDPD